MKRNLLVLSVFVLFSCSHDHLSGRNDRSGSSSAENTKKQDIYPHLMSLASYCRQHPNDKEKTTAYLEALLQSGHTVSCLYHIPEAVKKGIINQNLAEIYIKAVTLSCVHDSAWQRYDRMFENWISAEYSRWIGLYDSLETLNTALRNNPDKPELYRIRGTILMQMNEYEAAQWDLNKALSIKSSDRETLFDMSYLQYRMKNNFQALHYFNLYKAAIDPKKNLPDHKAETYGKVVRMLSEIDSAELKHGLTKELLVNKVEIYLKAKETDLAMELLNRGLQKQTDADLLALRAYTHYLAGDRAAALKDIEEAEKISGKTNTPLSRMIREKK